MGVVELDAELSERGLDKAVEALVEGVCNDKAESEIDRGVNDALAELFKMLHEAHAGQLGALGDGLAGFLDGLLGINHGAWPAPIVRLQGRCLPEWWVRSRQLEGRANRRDRLVAVARPAARRRRLPRWSVAECAARYPVRYSD